MSETNYIVKNCISGERKVVNSDIPLINEDGCGCPDGFTFDEEIGCFRVLTEDAVFSGSNLQWNKAPTHVGYAWGGANFYTNLNGFEFPITEQADKTWKDANNVTVPLLMNVLGMWANTTGSNGRLNDLGIWNASVPNNQWVGISRCLELPEKTIINFGFSGDDAFQLYVNGELWIDSDVNTTFGHSHWHVFQFLYQPGTYVFELKAKNYGSLASMAFETYLTDQNTLMSMSTLTELDSVSQGNSLDFIGQWIDSGTTIGWHCETEGFGLNKCDRKNPFCFKIEIVPYIPCSGKSFVFNSGCECWEIVGVTDKEADEYVTVTGTFDNCEDCLENKSPCADSERTIAYATRIIIPEPPEPDRGFKECCYDNLVLASLTSDKYHHNDFNSFFFQKQISTDECDFVLIELSTGDEFALNNGIYGQFWDFGDFTEQPNLTVYKVEWKKVLQVLGSGLYQIKKEITVAGMTFTELSNTYNLEQFTTSKADETVRIDCVMDGKLIHLGVDFKGTGYSTSCRTKGYFGNRNPEYEQDNIVKRNYEPIQISMSQENEYHYQTGLLPVCITEIIYDFILFGNKIYLNDYNRSNHSYQYNKFWVELSGNKGANYYAGERHSRINLTFTDSKRNKRKLNC